MTFYEQELRKIIGEQYPDATYVGRVCYVRLSDMNRAKIQFVTGSVANQYNALQLTILNRSEGQVDTLRLRFSDLLGTKVTSNPNFRNGVDPHIWDDYGKVLRLKLRNSPLPAPRLVIKPVRSAPFVMRFSPVWKRSPRPATQK